ncbi:PAS domain-containing protein [Gluconobacter japonicus]|uniref:sensor histidine kinase n=1 Tax=Gluconobacter japonicus TaxID=376620 RepID=UPI0024AD3F36|nr:ATP-binding protein [Gluconobacter japonicus]MDI6653187.1 PAS domain-containing protein [Gluconobacter japonicus]
MRVAIETLLLLSGIIAACLITVPAWQHGFYATSVLLSCLGIFCAGSVVDAQIRMAQRLKRQEPSVVRSVDREKLRNRALLDHAPVPLLIQYVDGTLHAANRAARRLFMTEGVLRDPPPPLVIALENDGTGPEKRLIRLASSGGGSSRVYALSVGKGGGAGGSVAYLALTDVEAGLNAAEAQALRDLLQILSHEIMNSLTPIVSLSATAEDLFAEQCSLKRERYETDDLIIEALGTIRRRTEGLDRFVRGYRDLTRLPEPDLKLTDLGALVQEIVRIFTARWKECVALDVVVPSGRIMVRLDAVQMEQALLNLLNNGAEAALAQPDPQVQLAVEAANDTIAIRIRDNGPGIDMNLRDQILSRLYPSSLEETESDCLSRAKLSEVTVVA